MAELEPEQSFFGRALDWLKEQHARRFVVEKDGRVTVDLPLTVFVVGALMAPHVTILGLVLAFATRHEVHVETPSEDLFGEELELDLPDEDAGAPEPTGDGSEPL